MSGSAVIQVGCTRVGGARLVVMGPVFDPVIGCLSLDEVEALDLAGPGMATGQYGPPVAVVYTPVDAAAFGRWYAQNGHRDFAEFDLVFREGEAPAPLAPPPEPVPSSVSNFQARFIMRQTPMPDGRSLFTTVDKALRDAVEATRLLPEFDPARLEADVAWQAWEQANEYLRDGQMMNLLATRFGFPPARTDALFRDAAKVRI